MLARPAAVPTRFFLLVLRDLDLYFDRTIG
jgi:hypothetical protein